MTNVIKINPNWLVRVLQAAWEGQINYVEPDKDVDDMEIDPATVKFLISIIQHHSEEMVKKYYVGELMELLKEEGES